MSGFLLSGVGLCSMTLVPYGNKSLIHSMEGGRVCARWVDKYASLWWRTDSSLFSMKEIAYSLSPIFGLALVALILTR